MLQAGDLHGRDAMDGEHQDQVRPQHEDEGLQVLHALQQVRQGAHGRGGAGAGHVPAGPALGPGAGLLQGGGGPRAEGARGPAEGQGGGAEAHEHGPRARPVVHPGDLQGAGHRREGARQGGLLGRVHDDPRAPEARQPGRGADPRRGRGPPGHGRGAPARAPALEVLPEPLAVERHAGGPDVGVQRHRRGELRPGRLRPRHDAHAALPRRRAAPLPLGARAAAAGPGRPLPLHQHQHELRLRRAAPP
mmetsp:Transcript_110755/g.313348  ORF Transcript_110755/g.313348 Transcript_110755/m.313348 type:complete len:248 (+) Transcript_110755:322-1065(+)